LYGREDLEEVLGFFFLKKPKQIEKISQKSRGFDPQIPSLKIQPKRSEHLI